MLAEITWKILNKLSIGLFENPTNYISLSYSLSYVKLRYIKLEL